MECNRSRVDTWSWPAWSYQSSEWGSRHADQTTKSPLGLQKRRLMKYLNLKRKHGYLEHWIVNMEEIFDVVHQQPCKHVAGQTGHGGCWRVLVTLKAAAAASAAAPSAAAAAWWLAPSSQIVQALRWTEPLCHNHTLIVPHLWCPHTQERYGRQILDRRHKQKCHMYAVFSCGSCWQKSIVYRTGKTHF